MLKMEKFEKPVDVTFICEGKEVTLEELNEILKEADTNNLKNIKDKIYYGWDILDIDSIDLENKIIYFNRDEWKY